MGFCKIRVALGAAALALTAACGDSGPSEFDAVGMQADLEIFEQLDSDAEFSSLAATLNGISGAFGDPVLLRLQDVSVSRAGRAKAGAAVQSFFAKDGAPVLSASLVSIPPEVAGKTYAYDPESGDWVASELTGAPANGVRFLLYAVDAFGDIVTPLVETGHVDLTDLSSGSGHQARLVAVSGGVTKADYQATATGDETDGTITVDGFVGTGNSRLDMDFSADVSTSGDDVTFAVASRLEFPGHDVLFDVSLDGTSNDVTETYSAELEQLIETPNGRVELAGEFQPETHLVIRVNGDVYATYDGDEDVLTGANGRVLTTDEQGALFGTVYVLELTVFVPLFFVTPLAWIVGDIPGIF
ncbi:MAG TPA: hypothetical protein VF037_07605 [Gemmatimonadales bacterium]